MLKIVLNVRVRPLVTSRYIKARALLSSLHITMQAVNEQQMNVSCSAYHVTPVDA